MIPEDLPREMANLPLDTLVEAPHSTLTGVARVLVHAGKLNANA